MGKMHDSASLSRDDWLDVVRRLSTDIGLDLDELARHTKALTRRRGVPNAGALLRLALARGPGGMSLRQTASWAHLAGVAELCDASLNDRLHQSCDFLAAIVTRLLAGRTPGSHPNWPSRVLRVSDGSCVSKPGSKGTDWRVHGVYDLGAGGFSHLEVTDQHGGEGLDRGAGVAGEIRFGDRNYSNPNAMRRFTASGESADYVVRLRWSSLRLSLPAGEGQANEKFDLIQRLRDMPADKSFDDVEVVIEQAGAPGARARVVILRKPEGATQAERARLRSEASRRGKQLDPRSLIAAEFIILATSLPADEWPAETLFALYRLRWQIELAFKRLKSLLHLDRLPAVTEKGARGWIYAHLIIALLADDASQDFLDSSP